MPAEAIPPPLPNRTPPDSSWEHYQLWQRMQNAIKGLPEHFKSAVNVTGINAVEIFTFGAVLSSTIELEVVRALNFVRVEWDPDETYRDYLFVRQAEGFPDVLLRHQANGTIIEDKGGNFGRIARIGLMDTWVRSFDDEMLLGIKLKQWRKFFIDSRLA